MTGEPISPTGKWVTPDGRVVEREPVEGRQLVAPGTPITPDIRASIEQAEAVAPQPEPEPEPDEAMADSDGEGDGDGEKDAPQPARKRTASK